MYIMVNDQILATEELRCIRPTGNRIEFWEHGWWTQPQCLYCRNVSDAQYLYGGSVTATAKSCLRDKKC